MLGYDAAPMTGRDLRRAVLLLAAAGACAPEAPAPSATDPEAARIDALASAGRVSFATESTTCAVVDGGVQCWGAGGSGQLGDGLIAPGRPLPVRVPTPPGVTAIATGGGHACAVAGGELWCWGGNAQWELGATDGVVAVPPRALDGLPPPVGAIAAGGAHTCAVAAGSPWCWGGNAYGQLGTASSGRCRIRHVRAPCSPTPLPVPGLPRPVRDLALGAAHSCAVAGDAVWCWGRNDRGQLGDGSTVDRADPAAVALPAGVGALAAGHSHTCAVAGGELLCWGANEAGQLGDGGRGDRALPVRVRGLPGGVTAVAAGHRHSCALAAGEVHCWGENGEGQLGGEPGREGIVRVAGLGGAATALSAGADVSCAVLDGARVSCWGDDDFGQLGRGRRPGGPGPLPVGPWDAGSIRDADGDGRIVVACLGDSNTQRAPGDPPGWCEELEALLADPAWKTVNRGIGGATATRTSMRPAETLLEYALAHDAADVVVAALGTNDLLEGVEPARVVEAHTALKLRALSHGVAFFAALTPPALPAEHRINPAVEELNGLLRAAFPDAERVDFASGLTPQDYADRIHLSASGQARLARAALAALRRAGAPAGGEPSEPQAEGAPR